MSKTATESTGSGGIRTQPRERGPKRGQPATEQAPRAPGRQLQDAAGPTHAESDGVARGVPLRALRQPARRCRSLTTAGAARCGVDLHSCVQCVSFDTSARFECSQPELTARVSPKDARNACPLFAPRTTVERQTGTPGPTSARQAFDDLFK